MQTLTQEDYALLVRALDELEDAGVDMESVVGRAVRIVDAEDVRSKADIQAVLSAHMEELVAEAEREADKRKEAITLLKAKLILMRNEQEAEELKAEAARIASCEDIEARDAVAAVGAAMRGASGKGSPCTRK